MNLGLTSLRETWMSDLNRLWDLYISGNPFAVLPPLQLWFPNLKAVYARSTGLASFPVALIKAMKSPAVLKLTDNSITDIPQRDDFEPITKRQQINLKGNPLHCYRIICWIKVRWRYIKQVCVPYSNQWLSLLLADINHENTSYFRWLTSINNVVLLSIQP